MDLEKLDDETLICECFCVNVRDIRDICGHLGHVDLQLLQNTLGLGNGCRNCLKEVESWHNKIF